MRRIYTFISLLFITVLFISGCYTTVSTKRLTKQAWMRNHQQQFFPESKWTRGWNDYYWNPNIKKKSKKSENGKVIHDKDIDETKTREKYYPEPYYEESHSSCCIIYFLDIFSSDEDNDSSTTTDSTGTRPTTPSQPHERRGM